MAKKSASPVTMTVAAAGLEELTGTITDQSAAGVTIRAKKPRSSKFEDHFIPSNRLALVSTDSEGESTVVHMQHQSEYDEYTGVHEGINEYGLHQLQQEDGTVVQISPAYANVGTQEAEGEDEGGGKKKAPAAKKAAAKEAPAKGKAKKADDDGEGEGNGDEYEPEEGDFVKITDEDDEVVKGTVTAITAKTITIEDGDEETHKFKLADVTVEAAKAPAKKGKAKPAATDEDEDEDEPKAKAKAKGKKAGADDDWD